MRHLLPPLLLGLALGVCARGEEPWTILSPTGAEAIVRALDVMNLSPRDPGFGKDLGDPRWALPRVRAMLEQPLDLPRLGEEVAAAAAGADTDLWPAVRAWLDLPPGTAQAPAAVSCPFVADGLDPVLAGALGRFAAAAAQADAWRRQAYAAIPAPEQVHAAAESLVGTFLVDDHPELRPVLARAGIPGAVVDGVIAEEPALDPQPDAMRLLDVCRAIELEAALRAAQALDLALADLRAACTGAAVAWPPAVTSITTVVGPIVIGTTGADRFDRAAVLILDPGGDDAYAGDAGSANGLTGQGLAAVLDLAGDDRYDGSGLLAPGAALMGVGVLVDAGGRDTYRATRVGTGAALFGGAWVRDEGGDDVYQAAAFAQGAAVAGFAVLRDEAGDDRYDVGLCGQGYAGVRAVGLLADRAGNDRYVAGGRQTDYDRNLGRFVSMAQGCAVGMRPFAGGGIGALVDLAGNDGYEADVFGQGVGYWYAAGLLLDRGGEDTYQLFQYGQGSGIHLSLGLLADGGGRDAYSGYILAQGNAHDLAVGMLIDQGAADDTYTGDHHVQGAAINNAFALLLDEGGGDAYLARQPDHAQGIGDDGADREYGSLSLLVDLAGADRYTSGATNGVSWERPNFGVVFDVPDAPEASHVP